MLIVLENETAFRKLSGGTSQLRTSEDTVVIIRGSPEVTRLLFGHT